jgi:methylenetetrahydrofolate reductase (NADPH)
MSFADRLFGGRFPVSLEITPPQRPLPAVLLRRASLLGAWASAVNVIQRPGRQPSLDASLELRGAGLEPAWHLVTRGRTRASLDHDLGRAREGGLGLVLCILGDHPAAPVSDGLTIREAVAATVQALPAALVGATFNQYAPDAEAAHRNLLPKLSAGARYVQTQPVFDLQTLAPHAARIKEAAPGTRVVAMAMPLLSAGDAEKLALRLGIPPPPGLVGRLDAGAESAWAAFAETVTALASSPLVDGLAIMTFEMDPPAETGARVIQALRAAGLSPASPDGR